MGTPPGRWQRAQRVAAPRCASATASAGASSSACAMASACQRYHLSDCFNKWSLAVHTTDFFLRRSARNRRGTDPRNEGAPNPRTGGDPDPAEPTAPQAKPGSAHATAQGTLYARFLAGGAGRRPTSADGCFGGRKATHQGKLPEATPAQALRARRPEGGFRYREVAHRAAQTRAQPQTLQKAARQTQKKAGRSGVDGREGAWSTQMEADALAARWRGILVSEVPRGRKHWHSSRRGAALCRLARPWAEHTVRPARPSMLAQGFASMLPLLAATLVCEHVRITLAWRDAWARLSAEREECSAHDRRGTDPRTEGAPNPRTGGDPDPAEQLSRSVCPCSSV